MHIFSYVQFLYEMLLNTRMNANMQLATTSFGTFFHDKIYSLTFPWQV